MRSFLISRLNDVYDRRVCAASGNRSPYSEGKNPLISGGLSVWLDAALPLRGAPELGCADTAECVRRLRGRRRTGSRLARHNFTFLHCYNFCVTFCSFFGPPFHPPEWRTEFGYRGEEAELPSDGAPGLRELRAHGGHKVNDAGGWTLLPGKDRV